MRKKHLVWFVNHNLSKPKTQKQSEESKINSIRNPFQLKKETKQIKDRIIRDVKTLFEGEEEEKEEKKLQKKEFKDQIIKRRIIKDTRTLL